MTVALVITMKIVVILLLSKRANPIYVLLDE
jgi:hypothetical protein